MSYNVMRVYEQNTSINVFEQFDLKLQKMCSTRDYVTLEFTINFKAGILQDSLLECLWCKIV